jgi:hypothetical protein
MVQLKGPITGPVFACDSKKHYREWFDVHGIRKEFRGLLGVVVNPQDSEKFDQYYYSVLAELLSQYGVPQTKPVYNASDIGNALAPARDRYDNFCRALSSKLWDAPETKVSYVVTRINRAALLEGGKVRIHGDYGSPTQDVSIPEFLDLIEPYYNVLAVWRVVCQITRLRGAYCMLDGTDSIAQCEAWRELVQYQIPRIFYNGDKTVPVIAAADIMLRSLDFELERTGAILSEDLVRQVVTRGVDKPNLYFVYLGNPQIQKIKPQSKGYLNMRALEPYIQHPIMFLSAGGVVGQRAIIEGSELMDKVLAAATKFRASVKLYDPVRDRYIAGVGESEDYFVPLTETAGAQFQALKAVGKNIRLLDPTKL